MQQIFRHYFRFFSSLDMVGDNAAGATYHVLFKVDNRELPPIRLPAESPHRTIPNNPTIGYGWFHFAVDAPMGSSVQAVLVGVDRNGNQTTPLPVTWTVDGTRILRRPGVPEGMLSMDKIEGVGEQPASGPSLVQLTVSAKSK